MTTYILPYQKSVHNRLRRRVRARMATVALFVFSLFLVCQAIIAMQGA